MAKLTNYVAFVHPDTGVEQIGHLDQENSTIQPLSFGSGTPVGNLYQVIEAGSEDNITAAGSPLPTGSAKILPVISGRDVLAVGKNYMEHAKEFNSSGFDSSDKVDRPSHPVIFTKRATSIIADGEEILLHEGFTSTVDYEGEIGVIISKPGFRVSAQNAWDYVWGYTIINDVTARERQRDHKQFYVGKSPDSFCPMVSNHHFLGPAAGCGIANVGYTTGPHCSAKGSFAQDSEDPDSCERGAAAKLFYRRLDLLNPRAHRNSVCWSDFTTGRRLSHRNPCGRGYREEPSGLPQPRR